MAKKPIEQAIDAVRLDWSVRNLVDRMVDGTVDFDTPIQRGYVWNRKKDSLLIRSIIKGIPISNFYFNKVGKVYEGLEGKQRSSAMYGFIKGHYALHASSSPIMFGGDIVTLAGKKFEELPDALRHKIETYVLDARCFDEMTLEDKIEFFVLTNSGKPVTPTDISRIKVKSRNAFIKLAEHPAIATSLSASNKKKCMDEDVIQDAWLLCFEPNPNLLNVVRGEVLAQKEMLDWQVVALTKALAYLTILFTTVNNKQRLSKMKAKTHLVSLIYMAHLANEKEMSAEEFVEKVVAFFNADGRTATVDDDYNAACLSGSARADQVAIRMEAVHRALEMKG